MITHLTTQELNTILRCGGGLTVSAGAFSFDDLKSLARHLQGSAVLHIVRSSALTGEEMATIARHAPKPAYVMFSGKVD